MEERDAEELTRILTVVGKEGGYMPTQESFLAMHTVIPWPAVEALLVDPDDPKKFFLTWREDEYWHGWHIPGSYIRVTHASLEDACRAVAEKELGNTFTITSVKLIDAYLWPDHPYGHPISLVYACRIDSRPPLNERARFFSEIPSPIVPHHADFVKAYLRSLSGNHP